MKIPEPQTTIASLIDAAHESRAEVPRPHMGCSQLGHPCDRYLWLVFRYAVIEKFPGRILRLFRRGHREEATIVEDLRAIGITITHTGADQSRVEFGAHVAGSIDGVIESGVPEAPRKRHIAEFKTHSKKSFDELEKLGVEKAKPLHFVQMQLYMLGTGIDRALYVAVCKDDDRLYTERVRLDEVIARKYLERGQRLALADRMPPPISTDPSWYQCKRCAAHSFCHGDRLTKQVNCRTCAHSTAKPDSTWRCERHDADGIPEQWQRTGCDSHTLHPDLVPWRQLDGLDNWTAVYEIDGQPVANGEPCANIFASAELIANGKACANRDIAAFRAAFDGSHIVE